MMLFISQNITNLSCFTSTGLLCGAYQFELTDLQKACWQYVDTRLQHGHTEKILASYKQYQQHATGNDIVEEVNTITAVEI